MGVQMNVNGAKAIDQNLKKRFEQRSKRE